MSQRPYKRKRSLQDISEGLLALENWILKHKALEMAGVKKGLLVFDPAKIATESMSGLPANSEAIIKDLHSQINQIYTYVDLNNARGPNMILEPILLALNKISATDKRGVAIFPLMRIGNGDGILISNPISGYELRLSPSYVDYMVIEYEDIYDNRDHLLSEFGRTHAIKFSKSRLFLVAVAKERQSPEEDPMSYTAEAISLVIALLKSANLSEVENGILTCYESTMRSLLSREGVEHSDLPICEILKLAFERLRPSGTDLFKLCTPEEALSTCDGDSDV